MSMMKKKKTCINERENFQRKLNSKKKERTTQLQSSFDNQIVITMVEENLNSYFLIKKIDNITEL